MRPLPLSLYAAATGLLEPFAPLALRARARRGKEDAGRLAERLGRAGRPRPEGPLVWLHGVSVGESLSLLPLIAALNERRPDITLLVTSGTATSAALLAQRLPAGVIHQFAPVDAPRAVARFLDHWRPAAGLFVESELWPNLIAGAAARGVKLALVSARMTDESAAGWAKAPGAARALLSAFDLVLPQDPETATRLAALGAQVGPQLNLKLVGEAPPVDAAELKRLRAAVGARKVVLAASTHVGEETPIALAFQRATAKGPPALLVVAPRHPDRGAAVAAELAGLGLSVTRRAAGEAPGADAYVADTLGEMGLLFSLADVTVMGGSLLPGIGGHNPLEPARLGRAVITGQHAFNARTTYDEMFDRVAAVEAVGPEPLVRAIEGMLAYPQMTRRMGEAALDYAEAQGQALEAAMSLLEPLLP